MLCKYSSKYTRNLGEVRATSLAPYTIHFELIWSSKMAFGVPFVHETMHLQKALHNRIIILIGQIEFYLNNFSPFDIPVFMFISHIFEKH
jgi:hypothetical protein